MKLVCANLGAHGHVNPTLPVVQELVRRGVDVLYLAPPEWEAAVKATGARFHGYDSLFAKKSAEAAKSAAQDPQDLVARFPLRLMEDAEHTLPEVMTVLDAEKPDGIWYDNMFLAARFAGAKLGIPLMRTVPSYAGNQHFSLGKQLANVDESHPARLQFKDLAASVALKWDLPNLTLPELFGRNEPLNVVFMPRAFQPFGDTFDESFVFVGPSIAPRPTAGTFAPPAGNKTLLFISLGTVFNDWPEFFSTCFEAFADTDWHVAMAVGNKVDKSTLGAVPDNFTVEAHLPQLDILQHAKAFVTHGGMNSTQEALHYGVPLVVIPQMMEQAVTARRVEELGLGKAFLERPLVTAEALRAATSVVAADPEIREHVAAMQKASRATGGYVEAAEVLIRHLP